MTLRKVMNEIASLGQEISNVQNAAFDIWTWLPSCAVARQHHGDYYAEFAPSLHDLLTEANLYIQHLRNPETPLTEEQKYWFEDCSCGEPHETAEESTNTEKD